MNLASYAAASVFPAKLLKKVGSYYQHGKLCPVHAQISLTNRCNLQCGFCSCGERETGDQLPLAQAKQIMRTLRNLGTQALTITGGGEPLMYPHFEEFVRFAFAECGIGCGLVTNGFMLPKIDPDVISFLTWCRVSASDDRNVKALLGQVQKATDVVPGVDWAFSYVATRKLDMDKVAAVVRFANDHDFTHVRMVHDLIDLEGAPPMETVKAGLRSRAVDDSKVIYQGRKQFTPGAARCLISLIKPVIAATGDVFPCCGVQYARDDVKMDFDPKMSMGQDLVDIWVKQRSYDGSDCTRCYYQQYNDVLALVTQDLDHEDFL